MVISTKNRILTLLRENGPMFVSQIASALGVSARAINEQTSYMFTEGLIRRASQQVPTELHLEGRRYQWLCSLTEDSRPVKKVVRAGVEPPSPPPFKPLTAKSLGRPIVPRDGSANGAWVPQTWLTGSTVRDDSREYEK